MKLAIIAASQTVQNTLESALSGLNLGISRHDSLADYQGGDLADIAVFFPDKEEAAKAEDIGPCFVVLPEESESRISDNSNFLARYPLPLRIGKLVEAVRTYIRNREQKNSMNPIKMGTYTLDPKTNQLTSKKLEGPVRLTEKEQDMLIYLHGLDGRSASRQDLLDHVWEYAESVETHTLETHIYRLRQKVEQNPTEPEFLVTDEDGYCLKF